jgi:hypothetical protein
MLLEYFYTPPILTNIADAVRVTSVTCGNFAVFVGVWALFGWNYVKIRTSKTPVQKFYPLVIIGFVLLVSATGFAFGTRSEVYSNMTQFAVTAGALGITSMQGLWIWYAAVRGLRVRTIAGTILTVCALLAITGISPWGYMTIPGIEKISSWLLDIMATAVIRGIVVGSAVGGVAAGLRTLIGREVGFIAREA